MHGALSQLPQDSSLCGAMVEVQLYFVHWEDWNKETTRKLTDMNFEILARMLTKIAGLWNVTLCTVYESTCCDIPEDLNIQPH
jgi:hypothetical protein